MINNTCIGLASVHTEPYIAPIGPNDYKNVVPGPVSFVRSYINNLTSTFTIVERSGMRHVVTPTRNTLTSAFIIRTEIRISLQGMKDIAEFLTHIPPGSGFDIDIIKKCFEQQITPGRFNSISVVIDHPVTYDIFQANQGSIYHGSLDIIISTHDIAEAPSHPYCEGTIRSGFFEENPGDLEDGNHSAAIKVEVVDNSSSIAMRYISIAKRLYTLIPKKDVRRRTGIYFTHLEKDPTSATRSRLVQTYYSLEAAEEELGVYKSKEEALTSGDTKNARKEELLKLEYDNQLLKQTAAQAKLIADQEAGEIAHNNLMAARKHEEKIATLLREKQDLESRHDIWMKERQLLTDTLEMYRKDQAEKRKDRYEEKSYERKDSSEIVKFLPLMILAIGGVVAAFNKITSSK